MQSADATISDVQICEISLANKMVLGMVALLDAVMNCSLNSIHVICSSEFQTSLAEVPVQAEPGSDLGRLRQLRKKAKTEETELTTTTVTNPTKLGERLKPITRKQSQYAWRSKINPYIRQRSQ
jgi:hypothetical protein